MTRDRKTVIEQQVQNGKIEEQVNSFNGRLRQLESDIAILPARYVGKEELVERLSEMKEEVKDVTPKKKLKLGGRSQTSNFRGKDSLPLQMSQSQFESGSVVEVQRSGGIEVLKEEVKSIGDNLNKIAQELGKVREKEEGGRQAMEKTLQQLVEIQRVQNQQLQSLIQKVGERGNNTNEGSFINQETGRSEILRKTKKSGEIELYEVEDAFEADEEKEQEEAKEKTEEQEDGAKMEDELAGEQLRKDEESVSNFEKFIGKFEEEEKRTKAVKVLSTPLKMVNMGKEQASKARINPNNSNFKIIFSNPEADQFLTSLGFKKSYSSIYEFQSQNWDTEVVKIKGVLDEMDAFLKKN